MIITENQFRPKTDVEIREETLAEARTLFGQNVNLGAESFHGILVNILAEMKKDLNEDLEFLYNQNFILKASGNSLSELVFPVTRAPAKAANVTLRFLRDSESSATPTIPVGTLNPTPRTLYAGKVCP